MSYLILRSTETGLKIEFNTRLIRKVEMEQLITITQVTKLFGVSTRMLRYYEEIGLLDSKRTEGYSYRVYDAGDCKRLKSIMLLRKLRIPLKQIALLLGDKSAETAMEVFAQNLSELEDEISSLSAIRDILKSLVSKLRERAGIDIDTALLSDSTLLSLKSASSLLNKNFKEDKVMDELNKVSAKVTKLRDKDVRIVYIAPSTVASVHSIGGEPENETGRLINEFIKRTGLARLKPDFRHFGFNHPNGVRPDGSDHGYERWVTIPEDMELKAPFVKKQYKGGLYAAHMIPMGSFEEWEWLYNWAVESDKYEVNWGEEACMGGSMEEHLNYINLYMLKSGEEIDRLLQLDLLLPVKVRE